MKFYTFDDFLLWKKYFYATTPCGVAEDSSHYTPMNSEDKEEFQINDVHDKSYRDLLNDKFEFSLFLKEFLDYDVSPDNLEKYNNAFITKNFENRRSDIVYKLKNEPVYIFVEHQSSIDYSMHYRLFTYYSIILNDTIDRAKLKIKDYKMPIIVPILLYTGNKHWEFNPNIQTKQANSTRFFNHTKININCYFISTHDHTIQDLINSNSAVGYIMATDKCTSKSELYDVLVSLSNRNISTSQKKILQRFIYFVFNKSFSKDIKDNLIKKFNEGVDDTMKCSWQYLIEDIRRDRAEGRAEGLAEGKRTGKLDGIIEIINNMLKSGESTEKISLYTGFSKRKIENMRRELKLNV